MSLDLKGLAGLSKIAEEKGYDNNNFQDLPEGTYTATIVDCGMVESKNTPGLHMIRFEFDLTEEGFEKRKHWVNWNVTHSNATVNEISISQFGKLLSGFDLLGQTEEGEPLVLSDYLATDDAEEHLDNFYSQLIGKDVVLTIKKSSKNGKDFTNTYVNAN